MKKKRCGVVFSLLAIAPPNNLIESPAYLLTERENVYTLCIMKNDYNITWTSEEHMKLVISHTLKLTVFMATLFYQLCLLCNELMRQCRICVFTVRTDHKTGRVPGLFLPVAVFLWHVLQGSFDTQAYLVWVTVQCVEVTLFRSSLFCAYIKQASLCLIPQK